MSLAKAKLLERQAFLASRTGEKSLQGFCAALALPALLLRNGLVCNWKHLVLPWLCLLPAKRTPVAAASAAAPASRKPATLAQ